MRIARVHVRNIFFSVELACRPRLRRPMCGGGYASPVTCSRTIWAVPLVRAQPLELFCAIQLSRRSNPYCAIFNQATSFWGRGEARTRGTAQMVLATNRRGIAAASHRAAKPSTWLSHVSKKASKPELVKFRKLGFTTGCRSDLKSPPTFP